MNEIVATDFNRWYECRISNENAVGMIRKWGLEPGNCNRWLSMEKTIYMIFNTVNQFAIVL